MRNCRKGLGVQFLSIEPLLDQTGQPYVFTNDSPLNAADPLGETPAGRAIACAVMYVIVNGQCIAYDNLPHPQLNPNNTPTERAPTHPGAENTPAESPTKRPSKNQVKSPPPAKASSTNVTNPGHLTPLPNSVATGSTGYSSPWSAAGHSLSTVFAHQPSTQAVAGVGMGLLFIVVVVTLAPVVA